MSETDDPNWRHAMYAPSANDKSTAAGPIGIRPDQHFVVPSLRYVQSIERVVLELKARLSDAETTIARLEMQSRTTRDAVRKNAAILSDVEGQVAGKLDAP